MPLLLLLVLEVLAVTADQQRFTRQPVDVVARLGDTVGGGISWPACHAQLAHVLYCGPTHQLA